MRISQWILGTSVISMGAIAVACSSSSSGGGGVEDAGSDVATTTEGGGEAAACVPNPMDVATLDGGSSWSCIQTKCMSTIGPCAADCDCNNAILAALACVQMKGAAMTQTCFTSAITPIATNTAAVGLIPCLTQNSAPCGGPAVDGGEGGTTDAPAGDAPTGDSPTGDAPASDAPASDAPTG